MKNISLFIQTNKEVEVLANTDIDILPFWMWIAIGELIIIIALFLKLKTKKKQLAFGGLTKNKVRKAKEVDVDMGDLMNSINNSKNLYKELSRSCHPDRFINSNKQKKAEEIFQEISENKRNFKKLMELKQEAITELNIKIK
ncbi:hypothetical protein JoomaDRAFT_1097 [Galbibacter orientalis DSM 19592]|uniref:Uncharacterized protein n=1 Tax=Galbibacter orientalis DSM 19592 TaxID=926559 RepID=I3C3C4_9FLAO|nr:hypothetical protein [Galbibacter orientalis]EIJ38117.1 hypothetical protein JoomaDRAFT_1097 [Galbibacter orientalis DSM 19592]